jgi:hypothetical protein
MDKNIVDSVSGEASLGLPDGDHQRSSSHGAEAHGRLDHLKRQVRTRMIPL